MAGRPDSAQGQRRRRRRRRDHGASVVELALIAPILVILVMGTLDIGRAYRFQIQLENAAREGAAFAQITPNDVSCADPTDDIEAAVTDEDPELAGLPDFGITVLAEDSSGNVVNTVAGCGGTTAEAGKRVRVEVSARFDLITPVVGSVLGADALDLTGSTEVVVQG